MRFFGQRSGRLQFKVSISLHTMPSGIRRMLYFVILALHCISMQCIWDWRRANFSRLIPPIEVWVQDLDHTSRSTRVSKGYVRLSLRFLSFVSFSNIINGLACYMGRVSFPVRFEPLVGLTIKLNSVLVLSCAIQFPLWRWQTGLGSASGKQNYAADVTRTRTSTCG